MTLSAATPELQVPDVKAAMDFFETTLGFRTAWYNPDWGLGAVARDDCQFFLRESDRPTTGAIFWVFAEDIDATFADLTQRGADITDPLTTKPWGLRQFTVADPMGNLIHFHHDV